MAFKFIAPLLLLLLLAPDVDAAAGDLNDVCTSATPPACGDTTNHVCDTNLATANCKVKVGVDCVSDGDDCVSGSTCTAAGKPCNVKDDHTQIGELVYTNAGTACPTTGKCLPGSTSSCSTNCACDTGYVASSDNTKCYRKEGQTCPPAGSECIPNSVKPCATNCACDSGYTVNSDNTQCSGAAAVTLSALLVTLMAVVCKTFFA